MDDRVFKIFENPGKFIYKIREIFLFYNVYIIEKEDGLVILKLNMLTTIKFCSLWWEGIYNGKCIRGIKNLN